MCFGCQSWGGLHSAKVDPGWREGGRGGGGNLEVVAACGAILEVDTTTIRKGG